LVPPEIQEKVKAVLQQMIDGTLVVKNLGEE